MIKIILASASPRRQELLRQIAVRFEAKKSGYEEKVNELLSPRELAIRLSRGKAEAVALRHPHAIVIGVDTLVAFQGKVLGKPRTRREATEMLKHLSGKTHIVITGFTIIHAVRHKVISRAVETSVSFRRLTPQEINSYVASGEPMDKAGAYAIQGLGALLIDRIEGDYYNVVGLPLVALVRELERFGVRVL